MNCNYTFAGRGNLQFLHLSEVFVFLLLSSLSLSLPLIRTVIPCSLQSDHSQQIEINVCLCALCAHVFRKVNESSIVLQFNRISFVFCMLRFGFFFGRPKCSVRSFHVKYCLEVWTSSFSHM